MVNPHPPECECPGIFFSEVGNCTEMPFGGGDELSPFPTQDYVRH